jgi:shikimate dehydrogenase
MHGTHFDHLALDHLPKTALVTDIVYTPLETPLLAAAAMLSLRTVDGLGMLLHQAVPGFEAWFGVRPEVTPELRAKIEATL